MDRKIDYKKTKKRLDGRKMDETRPLSIKTGVIENADGSAYLEWGQNKIYAAVYGPREVLPKHSADPLRSVIKVEYRMTSFSVPQRKRPGPNRRDQEISKVLGEALSRAVFVEQFPNTEIGVYVEVVDANAGSRVACLTAASVALADAGMPMRDMVAATGVGKAYGELVIDLNKDEEDAPDAVDIPIAILPNSEEIVLLQMDGLLTRKEWDAIAKLGIKGCKQVYEIQKKALVEKFELSEAKGKSQVAKEKTVKKKTVKKTVKKVKK
ncbi:MAG: exosome complex exonuclease Rrp41 [Candidatus Diapherotrites archaeon]|jgi:exosome complex component RRP41|nr:exosome complex exonuclease Rrp41 [Candidatus Diapherotrites archaeon]MBT4596552.1 exosome complex exonuclease Rrp41 [Candidatus Diapherotrites archaeon]